MLATLERPESKTLRPLDFTLPPELEAREPPEARGHARDQVRLLVSYRNHDRVVHATFREIGDFLDDGDLIVVNDSATIPAAMTVRHDGSELLVHLSTRLAPDVWTIEPRQTSVHEGERASLPAGGAIEFLAPYRGSSRLWLARLDLPQPVFAYLRQHGRPVKYAYATGDWPIEMYQTVYARRPGSAEMPSAGRPFSERVFASLEARGVRAATITLHCGVASLEDHEPPYDEWFEVPPQTVDAIAAARARDRRVVAVGTTVVRALESASDDRGVVRPARGWTGLVVTPERGVRAINALLTGFHEPKASHLAMLEAIAGRRHLEAAYAAALAGGYLWHEFGDLHLIR